MDQVLQVVTDWFAIEAPDEFGVRRIKEPHVPESRGGSLWLVEGSERCLLVETGVGVALLRPFIETITSKPVMAFASVGYYDHAGGLYQFDERLIHANDAHRISQPTRLNTVAEYYFDEAFTALPYADFDPKNYVMPASEPTRLLTDGDIIDLGDRKFRVLHLPGVTAGACGLFEEESGVLFTGEAFVWGPNHVYDGEPVERSDDADLTAFRNSIGRLAQLPATAVYPGHRARSDGKTMKAVIADYLKTAHE